jgi:hypothetical protein
MATASKSSLGDQLRTLEAGIKANFTDVQTVIVGGATYTPPQLEAQIETFLAAQTLTLTTGNAYHAAVAAEKTSDASAKTFRSQIEAYAISRYGKTSPILSQLGFTPAKPKKVTTAVKAVAVLKVKATRMARNTMGRKQKLKIVGTVNPSIVAAISGAAEAVSEEPAGDAPAPMPVAATAAPALPAVVPAGGSSPVPGAGHSG